jgi:hypothetical protein
VFSIALHTLETKKDDFMKPVFSTLMAGIALIAFGILALADQMGYLGNISLQTGMFVFLAASAFFFIIYFADGIRAWGWLFPACIFTALSGVLFIVNTQKNEMWIPTLILSSVAIPFLAAFLLDRSRKWALIPFFIPAVIGLIPALSSIFSGDAMGTFILSMIGLPFLAAYFITAKAWWGIIPAGILLSIGAMIAANIFVDEALGVALMFSGWALTSKILWKQHNLQWARIPTMGLSILAGVLVLISIGFQSVLPIVLMVAGLALILFVLRQRTAPAEG